MKQAKLKIRYKFNYQLSKNDLEVPTGVSQTIAGETYTIRELMQKHTRGILPEGIIRQGIYGEDQDHDSEDLQKVKQMDLYDQAIIADRNNEKIKLLKQKQIEIQTTYRKKLKEQQQAASERSEGSNGKSDGVKTGGQREGESSSSGVEGEKK